MSDTDRIKRNQPPGTQRGGPLSEKAPSRARLLRWRYVLYAAVVVALLVLRVIPSMRAHLFRAGSPTAKSELVIGGLDTAPELISRVTTFYAGLYPDLKLATRAGGTIQAIEDLLNRRADVAFLSRMPTSPEDSVVRAVGDSLTILPVALAGTLVLTATSAGLESLSVRGLREVLSGQWSNELGRSSSGRVYVSDPSQGLWGAITRQLGLSDTVAANVAWLQSDRDVVRAVAAEAGAIGLVSSLSLAPDEMSGCRAIRITTDPGATASDPTLSEVAGGGYPLYHYLYASCREGGGALASAFVSFVHGEQGQTLIRTEGFLPAREIAREIQLSQKPVGMLR